MDCRIASRFELAPCSMTIGGPAASRGPSSTTCSVAPATSTILPCAGNARCISSTPACVAITSPASATTTITVTIENVRKIFCTCKLRPGCGRVSADATAGLFHSAPALWIAGSYQRHRLFPTLPADFRHETRGLMKTVGFLTCPHNPQEPEPVPEVQREYSEE